LKYYFLKTVKLGQDLDFQKSHLVELLNADLANNVGNLFSRFTKLFLKHFPQGLEQDPLTVSVANSDLLRSVREKADAFDQAIEKYELSLAARIFVDTAGLINASIQQTEPWKIEDKDKLAEYLWTLHHCLADLTVLGASFVPELTEKARTSLNISKSAAWRDLGCTSGEVSVRSVGALFPRI
jgi:methionyl-tRNA synthetase